jgi:hypothetical protein
LRGEDLQDRMSKAEQEAVKIQSLTAGKDALSSRETARVFDLANAIQRLLQA